MKKHVKMTIYGEPGVGKSTFASKSPNPFYICTDGNFEWLDLPEENHIQVGTWEEAKKIFAELATPKYDWVETAVVDLLEDLFKWCEQEYCRKNKLDHIGDQGYGKGYDITRNEFFIEIGKLLNLNKNVILIMHGLTTIEKDRRGVEHTKYVPSNRLPDKVCDMIEGRVRYFVRCYMKGEENDEGVLVKRRYLSIIPKENEFGISRGIDESKVPSDIELDWNTFVSVIGLNEEVAKEEPKQEIKKPTPKKVEVKVEEVKVEVVKEEPKQEEVKVEPKQEPKQETKVKEVVEEDLPKKEVKKVETKVEEVKVEETKVETKEEPKQETSAKSKTDAEIMKEKIAAIKAKAAALKNKQ